MKIAIFTFFAILPLIATDGLASNQLANKKQDLEKLINAIEEVEEPGITCSQGRSGRCFRKGTNLIMCGEYMVYECEFTGYMLDYCMNPCSRRD